MNEQPEATQAPLMDPKLLEAMVGNIVSTTRYFDVRFDHMAQKVDRVDRDVLNLRNETILRFDQVDKRFEQVDKRFEQAEKHLAEFKSDVNIRFDLMHRQMEQRFGQVDRQFEQVEKQIELVNKRFEQVDVKLDRLLERIDVRIDGGLRENRALTVRLFSFALTFCVISISGLFARMFHLF
ncbi:MAG: hypothetical protein HQM03_20135 [Magnetococcales bacterium]|nr:hypothetical protein [Magnetococcales bacterium]